MGKNLSDYLKRYLNKKVLVYLNGNSKISGLFGFCNPSRGILNLIGKDFIVLIYGKSEKELCIPIHSIVGLKLSEGSKDEDEDEGCVVESHSLEK